MFVSLAAHAHYAWLVAASMLAGGMNAVAGGGSFLSFPAMLAMGVAPVQANATNTVAIWPGQLSSVFALRGDLRRDLLPTMMLCALLGGSGGAWVLLHTRQSTFLHILPWMLLAATLIFGVSGKLAAWLRRRRNSADTEAARPISKLSLALMMLPVCLYIGYFGAGAGFLIMTGMALLGVESMYELNSMKVLTACVANLSAVVTFILRGAVVWHYCVIAMVFAAAGGWVGAQYARSMRPSILRAVVVVTGLCVSAWFFLQQRGV